MPKPPETPRPPAACVWCTGQLGLVRDRTPIGLMHPDCGKEYRRRFAGENGYDSRLPKHLR